jgi:hypothetical protein
VVSDGGTEGPIVTPVFDGR